MIYVANSFSLGMVQRERLSRVRIEPTVRPVLTGLQWQSAVGHADTATLLGVPCNRVSIAMQDGDTVFVAQYKGPRLPEGTTTLPEGAVFEWAKITLAEV